MTSLFNEKDEKLLQIYEKNLQNKPLPERVRPLVLDDIIGQSHLIGENGVISKQIKQGKIHSMILWGEPGTGKTTLANIIANSLDLEFLSLSALDSGVKELRLAISKGEANFKRGKRTLLFIDEIHRFNKSQQDGLLSAVEKGFVVLIGATTENPSFEVNSALLSRSTVFKLNSLTNDDIRQILQNAIAKDSLLKTKKIEFEDIEILIDLCGGDARRALVYLENIISQMSDKDEIYISNKLVKSVINKSISKYDKKGENHYDTISAFIKSMRGSDPDAAIFWLAKMLDAGEDAIFIARRMVVFASEDIGNSDPQAIQVAISVFQACQLIGLPECRINLAQGVTYLASTNKSNAAYMAIEKASGEIQKGIDTTVPLHLRNAPTKLMKEMNYGVEYQYPHSFPYNFIKQDYFPKGMKRKKYYEPSSNGFEKKLKERLETLWQEKID